MKIPELIGRDEWHLANEQGRPFIVYKFAATLDGRVAAADGSSRWITSEASRAEVHRLRAACDAVVVGSGTQQADDPSLAARGATRQPLRVVVDTRARTPAGARVLDGAAPTLIAVSEDADARHLHGLADILRLPRAERGLDLRALLKGLFARGVRAAFLEGGPTLAGSFVEAGLVDRVINYIAPALLGAGKPGLGWAGVNTMADVVRLETIDVDLSGPDVRIVARPLPRAPDGNAG
jgi:diaminohydroxyphosphoribosylaminopyrimidine deaminase / 5-amino-6-(5-phosphoribosylamino)uracil reductase